MQTCESELSTKPGHAWLKWGCDALYTTGWPRPSTIVMLSMKSDMGPKSRAVPCEPVLTTPP